MAEERIRSSLIDLSIYSREAVLKSAHRFTGVCFVRLKDVGVGQIEIHLQPKRDADDVDKLMAEFLNDLLDQRLRTLVAEETASSRDLIMAHALSRTVFVRPDLETGDPLTDPAHVVPIRPSRIAK